MLEKIGTIVAVALAVVACSESEDSTVVDSGSDTADASSDGSNPPPPVDSGTVDATPEAAVEVKADNVGVACASAAQCSGAAATCVTTTTVDVPGVVELLSSGSIASGTITIDWPEGYCSAECASDGECGPGASCIGNEFVASLGPLAEALSDVISPTCGQECTDVSDCREGYVCDGFLNVLDPSGGLGSLLGDDDTYCLPEPPDPDAGMPDAGTPEGGAPEAGAEAGTTDGGDPDAASDAG